jgi:methyl-accepting chemotaxis protein
MGFGRDRRRQIVVDKGFQYRYTLIGALYIGVIAVVLALPFIPLLKTLHSLIDGAPELLTKAVARQEKFALLSFGLSILALSSAWIYSTILRSHKIAGPAYKLGMFMDGISREKLHERVRLRPDDELQSVAEALNGMLERLEAGTEPPARELTAPSSENQGEEQSAPESTVPTL